jgi:hypothetical protein
MENQNSQFDIKKIFDNKHLGQIYTTKCRGNRTISHFCGIVDYQKSRGTSTVALWFGNKAILVKGVHRKLFSGNFLKGEYARSKLRIKDYGTCLRDFKLFMESQDWIDLTPYQCYNLIKGNKGKPFAQIWSGAKQIILQPPPPVVIPVQSPVVNTATVNPSQNSNQDSNQDSDPNHQLEDDLSLQPNDADSQDLKNMKIYFLSLINTNTLYPAIKHTKFNNLGMKKSIVDEGLSEYLKHHYPLELNQEKIKEFQDNFDHNIDTSVSDKYKEIVKNSLLNLSPIRDIHDYLEDLSPTYHRNLKSLFDSKSSDSRVLLGQITNVSENVTISSKFSRLKTYINFLIIVEKRTFDVNYKLTVADTTKYISFLREHVEKPSSLRNYVSILYVFRSYEMKYSVGVVRSPEEYRNDTLVHRMITDQCEIMKKNQINALHHTKTRSYLFGQNKKLTKDDIKILIHHNITLLELLIKKQQIAPLTPQQCCNFFESFKILLMFTTFGQRSGFYINLQMHMIKLRFIPDDDKYLITEDLLGKTTKQKGAILWKKFRQRKLNGFKIRVMIIFDKLEKTPKFHNIFVLPPFMTELFIYFCDIRATFNSTQTTNLSTMVFRSKNGKSTQKTSFSAFLINQCICLFGQYISPRLLRFYISAFFHLSKAENEDSKLVRHLFQDLQNHSVGVSNLYYEFRNETGHNSRKVNNTVGKVLQLNELFNDANGEMEIESESDSECDQISSEEEEEEEEQQIIKDCFKRALVQVDQQKSNYFKNRKGKRFTFRLLIDPFQKEKHTIDVTRTRVYKEQQQTQQSRIQSTIGEGLTIGQTVYHRNLQLPTTIRSRKNSKTIPTKSTQLTITSMFKRKQSNNQSNPNKRQRRS